MKDFELQNTFHKVLDACVFYCLGAWLVTDGLYSGASREIASFFQEDLKRSEWSEVKQHTEITLVGVAPWGIVAGKQHLQGVFVRKFGKSC